MRKITLSPWGGSDAYVLHCPNCGGDFLHHHRITAFCRSEDKELVDVVSIGDQLDNGGCTEFRFQKRCAPENPSPRRGGFTIQLECEFCPAEPVLAIYQHKGQTVIEWVEKPLTDTKVA